MSWFKQSKQDKALIELLAKSKQGFKFDPDNVKYRLLSSISQINPKPVKHFQFSRAVTYSIGFASMVVVISTTFAFASTSKPGDKLFALNKFGENVVLNLPLSVEQKAKVQEYIVSNRLDSLDQVKEAQKLQAVKETDESLMSAVDAITENKKKLEASGKTKSAEKLEKVLDQLEAQAEKRQAVLEEIEVKAKDDKTRSEIRSHLKKIEASRKKARLQIRRFNKADNDTKVDDQKNPD